MDIFRIIKKNDTISFPFMSLKKNKKTKKNSPVILSNSLIFPGSLMLG